MANKNDDDDDDDDDDAIVQVFDTTTAYWYWLLGFWGLPFMHRYYMKMYNFDSPPLVSAKIVVGWHAPFNSSMFWFIVRCMTFNYLLLGWILDALAMNSLNNQASEYEIERIEAWLAATNKNFISEIKRLSHNTVMENNPIRSMIGKFLLYPIDDVDDYPWSNSREYLEADYDIFKAANRNWCEQKGIIGDDDPVEVQHGNDDNDSQCDPDDDDDDDDGSTKGDEDKKDTKNKPFQSYFAWLADFVVLANAATLAMEGFDDSMQTYLDIVGYFASIFFIVEAIVKSYAYGAYSYYVKDGGNAFDFTLVLVPTIGEATTLTTAFLGLGDDYVYPMLAVQSMRVFRITKLTKHLTGLKRLTAQAFGSPAGVAYALAVTIIFIVFCSLFGNELFRDSVMFAMRRNDFQYFFLALKAMIEFLFGENYFINLELGLEVGNIIGLFFFVSFFYIANYLVLRMFIALILENFEFTEDKRIALQIQLFQKRQVDQNDLIDGRGKEFDIEEQWIRLKKQNLDPGTLLKFQNIWTRVVQDGAAESGKSKKPINLWDVIIDANKTSNRGDQFGALDEPSNLVKNLREMEIAFRSGVYDLIEWQIFNLFVAASIIFSVVLLQVDPTESPILDFNVRQTIDRTLLIFFTSELFAKMYAFGMFSQPNPVRKTLQHPRGMPHFFSSTEEGGWNWLDFVFICISYVDLTGINIGNFKTIRIVRVVRPLQKNIETVKGLLAALFSSFMNILHVFNLLLLLMIIWGLIGVSLFRGRFHSCNDAAASNFGECIGTSYGGLPSIPCDFMDPNFPNGTFCDNPIGFFLEQPILVPRVWSVPNENFENMAGGTMFLFRLLCADNLRAMFHSLMDVPQSTELICSGGKNGDAGCPRGEFQYVVADQPRMDNKAENILFAIVYIFFANAFISQLVIGVLIDNIRQQTGTALFTDTQRMWHSTGRTIKMSLTLPRRATRPKDQVFGGVSLYGREVLYDILVSEIYDLIMMGIIVTNTVWMATEHWPAENWYHELKFYVDFAFVYIYLVETAVKIYSYGVIAWQLDDKPWKWGDSRLMKWLKIKELKSPYFGDPWCAFDFIVVALSVVTTFTSAGKSLEPLKLLRVLRVFRLVKKIKTLQVMIATLLGAITSIVSALFFLSIWIFLFSAIGMQFFSNLKDGEVIHGPWNFKTIINSMMLLFRISTGDGWFPLIYDASISEPSCTADFQLPACDASCDLECDPTATINIPGDCGQGMVAYAYFILFWFGCNFLFGPLFVATLIDYFFESQINENSIFNDDECAIFQEAWMEFDDNLSGKIAIENLRPLIERLMDLGSKVGFRVAPERDRYKKIWAKIMTDPINFPDQGLQVPEEWQESCGLEIINRETILKAFPNNNKSKSIRELVYAQTRVTQKEEVRFHYCAKILLIFKNDIKNPITSADLVNRGAALQQFMGFLGMEEVKGRDGAEKTRWEALAVHNRMVQSLNTPEDKPKKSSKKQAADVAQLTKIYMAVDYVKLDLKPPPPPPGSSEDALPKPTGDKREALMSKIDKLEGAFEEISSSAIEDLLYGTVVQGHHHKGIVDVLLDKIINHTVHEFATRARASIEKRFTQGQMDKKFSKQKRYSINILQHKAYEPVVSTVPRGWLNSHRKSKPKRLTMAPEIQDEMEDKTNNTLDLLSRMAPARPQRVDSVLREQMSRRTGRANDTRSDVLQNRTREMSQNQVWHQMFDSTQFRNHDQPPPAPTDGHAKAAFSWREQYSAAMDAVSQRISHQRPLPSAPSLAVTTPQNPVMDQLLVLGSMVGLCSAPRKPDDTPYKEEPDVAPGQ